MLHAFLRDLHFAVRQFAARPGFTATAIVVLSLGLGANTAIFSVVYAFLLRSLPYPQSDQLVSIDERAKGRGGEERMSLSPGNFLDWQKQSAAIEQMSACTGGPANLSSESSSFEPQRIQVSYCSGNLFSTLRVSPLLGRAFRPDEDRNGAPRVIIINYDLWQEHMNGDRDAIGKPILLDGDRYEVVGVMPPGFVYRDSAVSAWIPLLTGLPPSIQIRRDLHFLQVIGRVRDGYTIEQARSELDGLAARHKQQHPDVAMGTGAVVLPLHEVLVQGVHSALFIVLGAVGCVLLIACVNVANLLLTRVSARSRELAVRSAIGAGRGQIVRQLLTESILLAVAGAAAGLALAAVLTPVLMAHAPGADSIQVAGRSPLQPAIFLFAFAVALVTGISVGLYPALQSARSDVVTALRENTRSATAGRSHTRFRAALIAAEVALSLVLLVAAGLLMRSFGRLIAVNPGVRTGHVLTMRFSLPNTYKGAAANSAFFQQLSDRLRGLPGVESVGLASCPPVSGFCNTLFFYREDRPFVQGRFLVAREWSIDPGYLETAGIPLLRGRNFTRQDGIGFDPKSPRPGTVLINQAFAREFFPEGNPIGKRIFFDFAVQRSKNDGSPVPKYEIVGIVGDVHAMLDRKPEPALYRPLLDGSYASAAILLHTRSAPGSVSAAALRQIHSLDSSLAVYDVLTMEEILGRSAADQRFTMLLFGSFALLAMLLAAVGLYGVLSHTVTQRSGEIGIRMALGASYADVSRLVVWEGIKPALAGVCIGLAGAFFACRVLKSLLFGVAPLDPLTFSLVPPLLIVVAVLACYIPAVRAARTDPTVALRSE